MKVVCHSWRRFVLFSYDVSQGRLLFRSAKTDTLHTRCDVMFHDVRAMELRTMTTGLYVAEEEPGYLARFESVPLEMSEPGLTYHVLSVILDVHDAI